ncbi:MAG: amidohydrolase family protein [Bacillota bacterium]|jgi:predicted TIM-barrel fold metal-dependent hydrolase
MRRIIDFHAHLGDIFHTRVNVVWDTEEKDFGKYKDPFKIQEEGGFVDPLIGPDPAELEHLFDVGQYLCWNNTLASLTKKLDKFGVNYINIFPIHPCNTFEEMLAASKFEPRILPWSSANYLLGLDDMVEKLKSDIKRGARGLKIHPILQNISLADPKVHAAVELFASYNLPILSHCGPNDYYHEGDNYPRTPEFGDVSHFITLAKEYPNIKLIAGHAGGLMGGELEQLGTETKGMDNVYVDLTFRGWEDILRSIDYFGADHVLFGTDTPFSSHAGVIKQVELAVEKAGDPKLADMIFFDNAAKLLHIYR